MAFMASDSGGSAFKQQAAHKSVSKCGGRGRRFVVLVIITFCLACAYESLPDNERRWVNWFLGYENWYAPAWIASLAVVVFAVTLGCLLKYLRSFASHRRLSIHGQGQKRANSHDLEERTSQGNRPDETPASTRPET